MYRVPDNDVAVDGTAFSVLSFQAAAARYQKDFMFPRVLPPTCAHAGLDLEISAGTRLPNLRAGDIMHRRAGCVGIDRRMGNNMDSKPKLIVTGLSGLLGSCLARVAGGACELVNVARSAGIDIADFGQVAAALSRSADAVVHLAAFTDVSRAFTETGDQSGDCYRVNVVGTENVVRACREHGLHLIYASTDFVFDGRKDGAYTEHDAPHPIEWYGRTKLLAEEAVRATPSWTIVRTGFLYVRGLAPRHDLVRHIYNQLADGQQVRLFADQTITPTFGEDVARGLLLLARERPAGELFHIFGSTSVSPFELGLKIADVFGFDRELVRPYTLAEHVKTDPRPRQRHLRLSNAKWTDFAAQHGLDRPLTIDAGLARVRAAGL